MKELTVEEAEEILDFGEKKINYDVSYLKNKLSEYKNYDEVGYTLEDLSIYSDKIPPNQMILKTEYYKQHQFYYLFGFHINVKTPNKKELKWVCEIDLSSNIIQ